MLMVRLNTYSEELVLPVIRISMLYVPNISKLSVVKLNPDVSLLKLDLVFEVLRLQRPKTGS